MQRKLGRIRVKATQAVAARLAVAQQQLKRAHWREWRRCSRACPPGRNQPGWRCTCRPAPRKRRPGRRWAALCLAYPRLRGRRLRLPRDARDGGARHGARAAQPSWQHSRVSAPPMHQVLHSHHCAPEQLTGAAGLAHASAGCGGGQRDALGFVGGAQRRAAQHICRCGQCVKFNGEPEARSPGTAAIRASAQHACTAADNCAPPVAAHQHQHTSTRSPAPQQKGEGKLSLLILACSSVSSSTGQHLPPSWPQGLGTGRQVGHPSGLSATAPQ